MFIFISTQVLSIQVTLSWSRRQRTRFRWSEEERFQNGEVTDIYCTAAIEAGIAIDGRTDEQLTRGVEAWGIPEQVARQCRRAEIDIPGVRFEFIWIDQIVVYWLARASQLLYDCAKY